MKHLFVLLCIAIILGGCTDKNDPESLVVGSWELIAIQSSWTGEKVSGPDMSYTQTYQFRSDGTFTKSQRSEDTALSGSGTYTIEPTPANEIPSIKYYLNLKFTEGGEIAGDCQGLEKELLLYMDTKQIKNTWGQCDGPNLIYEK